MQVVCGDWYCHPKGSQWLIIDLIGLWQAGVQWMPKGIAVICSHGKAVSYYSFLLINPSEAPPLVQHLINVQLNS